MRRRWCCMGWERRNSKRGPRRCERRFPPLLFCFEYAVPPRTRPSWPTCVPNADAAECAIVRDGFAQGTAPEICMKLANKVALITGAGSGMGRAGALLFALEGAKVAVGGIDHRAAAPTARGSETGGGDAGAPGPHLPEKGGGRARAGPTV